MPGSDHEPCVKPVTMLAAAVHNNVVWCDTVCRAFGCDTARVDGLWVNRSPSPPYYPNAMTLVPDAIGAQVDIFRSMLTGPLPRPWSVKDGFHLLDLAPLGFEVLFEATWIGLERDARIDVAQPGSAWSVVSDDADLARWEAAWRGPNDDVALAGVPRLFRPALLDEPNIRFLSGGAGESTVALAIANRSDDGSGPVVGISNIVLPGDDPERYRAGIVSAVRGAFPGLPMVGYERGDDLAAMLALGFRALGPLRVWLSPA